MVDKKLDYISTIYVKEIYEDIFSEHLDQLIGDWGWRYEGYYLVWFDKWTHVLKLKKHILTVWCDIDIFQLHICLGYHVWEI